MPRRLPRTLRTAPRHVKHLVSRFFGYLTAQGLTPREQQQVHDRLDRATAALFWTQTAADQRHAFSVATRVATLLPGDEEAYIAALLHDVGKGILHLGPIRRSLATVLGGIGLPMPTSMRRYRLHGPIGAGQLSAAGCDGIVVAFATHHPAPAPPGIDEARWAALLEADG